MAYLEPIDLALWSAFNETMPVVNIEGVNYPVKARVHTPEEQFEKSQYPVPSFCIYHYDLKPSYVREYQKIRVLSDETAQTLNSRKAPQKFDFMYQITTMCYYTQHDRLLSKFVMKTLPDRGRLIIQEDGNTATDANAQGGYNLHVIYEGFQSLDRPGISGGEDFRIMSKAYSYRILGWLDEATKTNLKKAYAGLDLELGVANDDLDAIISQ